MRSLSIALSLLFAVSLAAQGAQSQPAADPSQAITVTGCLQANTTGSGSSPSSGGTATPGSTPFLLANAARNTTGSEAAAAAPTGASGASTPSAPGAVGTSGTAEVTSYVLHGRTDELASHIGHRIEIVGTASASAPIDVDGAPPQQVIPHEPQHGPVSTVASPDAAGRTAHPSVQHLTVQSARVLAETCK
jgi:hypothetical protein